MCLVSLICFSLKFVCQWSEGIVFKYSVDFSKERYFLMIAIYCTLFHLGVSIGIDRM